MFKFYWSVLISSALQYHFRKRSRTEKSTNLCCFLSFSFISHSALSRNYYILKISTLWKSEQLEAAISYHPIPSKVTTCICGISLFFNTSTPSVQLQLQKFCNIHIYSLKLQHGADSLVALRRWLKSTTVKSMQILQVSQTLKKKISKY